MIRTFGSEQDNAVEFVAVISDAREPEMSPVTVANEIEFLSTDRFPEIIHVVRAFARVIRREVDALRPEVFGRFAKTFCIFLLCFVPPGEDVGRE